MSLPQIRLYSGIQTPIDPDICFTLDSTDLGVLDTDILGGTVDTEIDASFVRSVSIQRGRSRQLDRFNSGSMSIVFDNRDRVFDPLNDGSVFAGGILPRLYMQLTADDEPIFTGLTTDWEVEYDITYQDVASVACSDNFTVLSNYVFDEDLTPGNDTVGGRLAWVKSVFGYPFETSFAQGNASLGAFLVSEGTQVMDYMFRVARSDLGLLFCDASGVLTYVGRFDKSPTSVLTFSDDGTEIPYQTLNTQYGDELLYSRVVASSPAGTVVVEDQDSLDQFGLSVLNFGDLLNDSIGQLQVIADDYLEIYRFPQVRFTGLSVELGGLSSAQQADVLALDLADQVSVIKTFQDGSPLTVTQNVVVSGIRHDIRPGSHRVEFTFERSNYGTGFTLNDAVRGTLDGDNVIR